LSAPNSYTGARAQIRYRGRVTAIVSFASGKGGVGKSTTVSNLGLLLARRGLSVVIIDLDVGGADLHVMFGELSPARTLSDFIGRRVETLEEVAQPISWCPRLRLIAGTGETLQNTNPAVQTKKKLERHIRKLNADVILLDIGAGTNYHALDFFLWADLPVVVSTPDPTAVLDLYKFVKLAATRRVLGALGSREPAGEALLEEDIRTLAQLMAAAKEAGPEAAEKAQHALASLRICMLLNQAPHDDRVGISKLRGVVQKFLGSEAVSLGSIPSDPSVTQSIRRFLPVVEFAPDSAAAKAYTRACDALIRELPELGRGSTRVPARPESKPLAPAPQKVR
jgi:flagellar biosynthesis protein FlhG